jgi:hypothetical protein
MKPTPAKLAMAVAGVLVVFAAFRFSKRRDHDQPMYGGRTLSQWLVDAPLRASHPDHESPTYLQASNAVVQIGTNGLPFLLKWIQDQPSPGERQFRRLAIESLDLMPEAIVPGAFRNWMNDSRGLNRTMAVATAFTYHGPQLAPVIPDLAEIAENSPSRTASVVAIQALRAAGPAAWPAIMRLATNTHSGRSNGAIDGLSPMETSALPAVPALIQYLRGSDMEVAVQAARVLGNLRLEPAIAVPALSQALQSTEPQVRIAAATALANFGVHGSQALPKLRMMLSDSNGDRRSTASNSIQAITAAMAAATNTP